jgi:hypothetical protein
MHAAADPRFKKRVPCRLQVTGSSHSGMVLNVSRSGLFVQTTAGASPGETVHLALAMGVSDPLHLHARVVWRRVVAPHLRTVSTGAWFGFVAGLAEGAPADASEPAPLAAGPSFRVHLRLSGSPRTRTLIVSAADAGEARERARQQAGAQWVVLDLVKIARED